MGAFTCVSLKLGALDHSLLYFLLDYHYGAYGQKGVSGGKAAINTTQKYSNVQTGTPCDLGLLEL